MADKLKSYEEVLSDIQKLNDDRDMVQAMREYAITDSHTEQKMYYREELIEYIGQETVDLIERNMPLYKEYKRVMFERGLALASAGAAYLDEHYPDWRAKVNATRLDMSSGANCILGQMFGDYDEGIRDIWYREGQMNTQSSLAREYGFLENGAPYFALDEAWQLELAKRP